MTVDDACQFFENIPRIVNKLKTLQQVGLGYIRLGQPATTLSGGEAQRVKLATELSKRSTGRTLYILDEPTTGLHTADIHKLMDVLQMLVDGGDTVVVIEHNLDVIKTADYLIDLGPEGGAGGGTVVATGTPEEICQVPASYTGKFLKPVLERTKPSWPARRENKPWLSAKPSGKRSVTCRPSPVSISGKMRRGKSFTSAKRQSAQPRDQLCPPRCQQAPKVAAMVSHAVDLETIVVATEMEASSWKIRSSRNTIPTTTSCSATTRPIPISRSPSRKITRASS